MRNVDKITAHGCKIKILDVEIASVQLNCSAICRFWRVGMFQSCSCLCPEVWLCWATRKGQVAVTAEFCLWACRELCLFGFDPIELPVWNHLKTRNTNDSGWTHWCTQDFAQARGENQHWEAWLEKPHDPFWWSVNPQMVPRIGSVVKWGPQLSQNVTFESRLGLKIPDWLLISGFHWIFLRKAWWFECFDWRVDAPTMPPKWELGEFGTTHEVHAAGQMPRRGAWPQEKKKGGVSLAQTRTVYYRCLTI